jgi:hypothetical protein
MFVHEIASGFGLLAVAIAPSLPPRSPAPPPAAPASISVNEANAIRTLRQIAGAEQTFRAALDVDTNCDRDGEFGYFAELAGTRPMRVSHGCQPAAGTSEDLLVPPLLPSAFGAIPNPPIPQGFFVPYKGYYFQVWLAGPTTAGVVSAVREDATGGKAVAPFPDPVNGARYWICYAWPVDYGNSGVRAFCINQRGFVLECANTGGTVFDGLYGVPWFDEALERPGDLGSPLRLGMPGGGLSTVWNVVP